MICLLNIYHLTGRHVYGLLTYCDFSRFVNSKGFGLWIDVHIELPKIDIINNVRSIICLLNRYHLTGRYMY